MMFDFRNRPRRPEGRPAAFVSLAIITAASTTLAQRTSGEAIVDISACIGIENDIARLACYDRLADATTAEPESSARRTVPASEIASDTPAPREPEEFMSEVASVREILPGRLEITLTNGQVWRQTNSDRYMLQPGHEVRLYTTRFGGYWRLTSTTLRGFVQVERVE